MPKTNIFQTNSKNVISTIKSNVVPVRKSRRQRKAINYAEQEKVCHNLVKEAARLDRKNFYAKERLRHSEYLKEVNKAHKNLFKKQKNIMDKKKTETKKTKRLEKSKKKSATYKPKIYHWKDNYERIEDMLTDIKLIHSKGEAHQFDFIIRCLNSNSPFNFTFMSYFVYITSNLIKLKN